LKNVGPGGILGGGIFITEILVDVAEDIDETVVIAQVGLFPLYEITGLSE
tara:strand:+ start:224 stop:373 length:150 start_codon:yes stop_codon:yes gene_type:complete